MEASTSTRRNRSVPAARAASSALTCCVIGSKSVVAALEDTLSVVGVGMLASDSGKGGAAALLEDAIVKTGKQRTDLVLRCAQKGRKIVIAELRAVTHKNTGNIATAQVE